MPSVRKPNVMPTFDELMEPLLEALRQLGGSGSIEVLYAKTVEIIGLSDEVLAVCRSALCRPHTNTPLELLCTNRSFSSGLKR